jgi:acetolactate synthase I/III small subunit
MSTHTISVFVENHSGALSRIAGLFSARGYNISSLTVAETDDPGVSRMTIVVAGDESVLEQVNKQLNRLIDVIKVQDFAGESVIDRELLMIRVDTGKSARHEIIELANVFGAKISSITPASVVVELTAVSDVVDEFVRLVKPYGIKEMVRSGKVAMAQSRK